MPAYNAAHFLPRSLGKILAVDQADEVLVVDPGSTDDTAAVATSLGAKVLSLGKRGGPAEARNAGVAATTAEVILFVDSDVVVHDDVVARVRAAFADDGLVALTGSYDDSPPDRGFFSQYMNLRHHHTHQVAKTEGATFWAGCGAVRRSTYEQVGGFDTQRFPRPMIEDIELGLRMRRFGVTRLDPKLLSTHLKQWSMTGVVGTDIKCRAIPWAQLILEGGDLPNDLNLRLSQRLAALISPLVIALVLASPVVVWLWPLALIPIAGLLMIAGALNAGLVGCFARRRGLVFAVLAFLFHQVHLFYSGVTYVLVALAHRCRLPGSSEST